MKYTGGHTSQETYTTLLKGFACESYSFRGSIVYGIKRKRTAGMGSFCAFMS